LSSVANAPAEAEERSVEAERAARALLRVDGGGHEVWLHVYDLGPVTGHLNEFVLRGANLGAFHCGVEVLSDEWSFQGFHDAWDDPTLCGVVRNDPKMHPVFPFRESVPLGRSPLNEEAIDLILEGFMEAWPANSYHIVSRNCVSFAEELAAALAVPEAFPAWVRGAVDASKTPAIYAVADYGWEWFKWICRQQTQWESQADADAGADGPGPPALRSRAGQGGAGAEPAGSAGGASAQVVEDPSGAAGL